MYDPSYGRRRVALSGLSISTRKRDARAESKATCRLPVFGECTLFKSVKNVSHRVSEKSISLVGGISSENHTLPFHCSILCLDLDRWDSAVKSVAISLYSVANSDFCLCGIDGPRVIRV